MSRTFLRFPEGKTKAITFSYDDGVTQDARLIDIFDKYGLKGTFNLNSGDFGRYYNEYQTIVKAEEVKELYKNHEVAVHGFDHDWPTIMPKDRIMHELFVDRCNIEKASGQIVRGCAYPWGAFDDRTVEIEKMAGICYARTCICTGHFGVPVDWLRLTPTCHHGDSRIGELSDRFVNDSPLNQQYDRTPWLFYIWGHAYEFDQSNNWDHMERLAEKVSGKEDVWYATNIEIYDYVEAYRSLKFSADGNMVYNPSAFDVWLERNRQLVCIPSGKTVEL